MATLEAERDEAWREAQEVAQEFDDFTDRIMTDPVPLSSGSKDGKDGNLSRRSSRVMVARKNSQRASKAGLRSMYRRSHRSSTSSNHRYSGAASPGVWSGPGGDEEIPPVPPIPTRRDLFDLGLGTRSSLGMLFHVHFLCSRLTHLLQSHHRQIFVRWSRLRRSCARCWASRWTS